jgi:hypothetical protein
VRGEEESWSRRKAASTEARRPISTRRDCPVRRWLVQWEARHDGEATNRPDAMYLQDVIRPTRVPYGAEAPAESMREMLPQMVVPAMVAVVLLVGLIWMARKAREGLRVAPMTGGGEAVSTALLLTLAKREQELAGGPAAIATRRPVATPSSGEVVAPEGAAAAYAGPVHCPACATQLGVAGPALRYVTRCPACARWIALRIEGERVIVEARKA